MGSENEPAKLLLPYLQRADELQKHEPLVAYYCRLYAMERGLKIPQKERTKTTNALLVSLMNQLEKDKKSLQLGPEDNLYVEGFASNVFAKADKQDRAGRADLSTAKTFYAASIFFEILNQFGEIQPDIEQKQKYAAWKAADIRRALKEGRKPEPGPPGDDKDLSIPSSTPTAAYDLGPSETNSINQPGPGADASPQFHDNVKHPTSTNIVTSPPSYPNADYPYNDFHPPPLSRQESSAYTQAYHQPYPHESQQSLPSNYPSHETSSQPYSHETSSHPYSHETSSQPYSHETSSQPYSYPNFQSYPSFTESSLPSDPNFQSYPSFTESSLPSAPSHYPSYHQGSDTSYSHQAVPPVSGYQSAAQYTPSSGNESKHAEPAPTAQTFHYDSNYQPPPEKVAEAHKAARFAVGALAFDDVPVAVEFLRKSLELLTNPSANQ
ncbi:protein HOMOLOG OF MAMMALIAN LYST-INTERACTING PROTEIN 5-like [Macadamia integrifolia]|uniref:protein HOMOLOG OF MAMMALIAN LYST-INTERACTING PROTEIN 5-like n=1 Tax=Macadamia integrifolia TaxID=60698 RepID=UPI001C531EE1|nr:protein HOMOLOG OF MAMMALIAN LYST-INTERACTING PROTEIN 5-like [Macadamia integrifolia]